MEAHIESCQGCAEVRRRHFRLLDELKTPTLLPDFDDLSQRILDRISDQSNPNIPFWQWATAAAMVIIALALGCFCGLQSAGMSMPQESLVTTYQGTLSISPSDTIEMAYLEFGGSAAPSAIMRKEP